MAKMIFKIFVVLGFLSLTASGEEGPPGKTGEPGLSGVQGPPDSPATVDYDKIFKKVDKKIRKGLQGMNSKFEKLQRKSTNLEKGLEDVISKLQILQSDVKELRKSPGHPQTFEQTAATTTGTTAMPASKTTSQRCVEEIGGLIYDGKCFYVGYIAYSLQSYINYNQAVQKCTSQDSLIAELHSLAHQNAIQDFVRSKILRSDSNAALWLGVRYQSTKNSLRLRSGKEIPANQFKWHGGYPTGSGGIFSTGLTDKVLVTIRNDNLMSVSFGGLTYQGLTNFDEEERGNGVICEKPL